MEVRKQRLGSLAQLVERHVYTVDVIGSIPVGPTKENPVAAGHRPAAAGFASVPGSRMVPSDVRPGPFHYEILVLDYGCAVLDPVDGGTPALSGSAVHEFSHLFDVQIVRELDCEDKLSIRA